MGQCKAKTKTGQPCEIPTKENKKYCHVHIRQRLWRYVGSLVGGGGIIVVCLAIWGFLGDFTSIYEFITSHIWPSQSTVTVSVPASSDTPDVDPIFTVTFPEPNASNELPTPTPLPFLRRGLDAGCIDSQFWSPMFTTLSEIDSGGCWSLTENGIYPQDGGLLFSPIFLSEGTMYGISTSVSKTISISLDLHIERLSEAEIWIGFFDEGEFNNSTYSLVYYIDQGAISRQFINYGQKDGIPEFIGSQNATSLTFIINNSLLSVEEGGDVLVSPTLFRYDSPLFFIGCASTLSTNGETEFYISDLEFHDR